MNHLPAGRICCFRLRCLVFLCLCTLANFGLCAPGPFLSAHAHNDYEHARPLFDALDHGFCSVEADIHLVNGQLLVAHDRSQVKPERTLQTLYLDPLRERARRNGGRVYPNGPEVILLVDVKSEGGKNYYALRDVIKEYAEVLTVFGA